MYAKYIKRLLDFFLSLIALIVFSPVLVVLTMVGSIVMKGNPFFIQPRPGKNEKIFKLIKFRTMTCEKDKNGNLLPDEKRLVPYGKFLRKTSLDELSSLINIIKGELAIVGPRPQLVRDMVFMTNKQRLRHVVRPGLTGLAQVNGRNNISWEQKFEFDLKYIKSITLIEDFKIILKTIKSVLMRSDISGEGMATAQDLGDYLFQKGEVEEEEYMNRQLEAKELLNV